VPNLKNRVDEVLEKAVLAYALEQPARLWLHQDEQANAGILLTRAVKKR